jgi:hypothetical protein
VRMSLSVIRFLIESAFIILIAAATAVAHLGKLWIALSVGGASVIVAMVERTALEERFALHQGRLGFLFQRPRAREARAEEVVPVAEEHPPTPVPEPEEPAPEPAPPAPEPQPPTPEPGEPVPQLQAVPAPAPEDDAVPTGGSDERAGNDVARLRTSQEPREWNIWELERLAQHAVTSDSAAADELGFLLLELRQFANAEGRLPVSFDPIVRESFGDLVYSAG